MPYSLYQRSHCPGRVAVVCSGQTPTCTTLPPPPPLLSLHSVNPPVRYTSTRPSPWGEPILFLLGKPYHFPIQIQSFLYLLLYHLPRNTLLLTKEIILLVPRGGGLWPHLQTHFVDMNLFYSFVISHLPFLASGWFTTGRYEVLIKLLRVWRHFSVNYTVMVKHVDKFP